MAENVVHSYDAGHQPYIHDPGRGKWDGKWDFYLSCLGSAFGQRNLVIFLTFMMISNGGFVLIPAVISTLFFIIPIFFVQSFMGQFSSSGYISVFRISPLFKGIGFVILALNFSTIIYYSTTATSPLLLFLKSFQLNTTWMYCDNDWNTGGCESEEENSTTAVNQTDSLFPSFEYYRYGVLKFTNTDDFRISWTMILAQFIIWTLLGLIVFYRLPMVSRALRYSTLICSVIAVILFVRILFLPEFGSDVGKFFAISNRRILHDITWAGPLISVSILGRGWGSMLTLASYQPFKANTELYSAIIPLIMLVISFLFGIFMAAVDGFVLRRTRHSFLHFAEDDVDYLFFGFLYFFGKLEFSQFWSMLFYLLLFLGEMNLLIIQLFSIMTALTDEYERLRNMKNELAIGLCITCFLASIFFAIEYFSGAYSELISIAYTNQMLICFLEIMIVVWIYGRERFLRNVRFMLVRNVSTWKFYIIRFIAPIFILFCLLFFVVTSVFMYAYNEYLYVKIFVLMLKVLSWIFIPLFIVMKLSTTIGTIKERFIKCTRPNDWYPADPADKQRYDLALGTSDISQQLLEMNENS